ncbi:unnamed protein product [Merluccius merluccius]
MSAVRLDVQISSGGEYGKFADGDGRRSARLPCLSTPTYNFGREERSRTSTSEQNRTDHAHQAPCLAPASRRPPPLSPPGGFSVASRPARPV